jgi:TonB family protein
VRTLPAALLALAAACGEGSPATVSRDTAANVPITVDDSPVALNAESPVLYPPELFARRIEGEVILRLYVDERGVMRPESTRVVESSGYPAFDSAAAQGARQLRFAPARKNGMPVGTSFIQPVEFRHPSASVLRGEP